jgi:NADPH2:quinone reductase
MMPPMSRAIRIHRTGGPEVLEVEDVSLPPPGPGQALVRQRAVGINYIDTYHRSGLYRLPALPSGIGSEAAGVVEAIGPDVVDVKVGDRVAYAGGPVGAYAERRVLPADRLVPLPHDVSEEAAAALLLKGMTVEYLIRRTFPVRPGQTVLWHAAAGGVGLIACQWLRHLGVTVIGTVGSPEKAELAREHGCTHTILYTKESFRDRVRELTRGRGVPVVFDSVGRATFLDSLDCLEPRGLLAVFGNASGKPEPFDVALLADKGSLFVTRPTLMAYTRTRDELLESAAALFDLVRQGIIRPIVGRIWPLAQAQAAHRALEARETTGSSLLVP